MLSESDISTTVTTLISPKAYVQSLKKLQTFWRQGFGASSFAGTVDILYQIHSFLLALLRI
jgi:hypothetical protein